MTNQKKSSRFGLGVLIGTIVGGLTAFFLTPKSGKENREEVLKKLAQLRKQIEEMEIDKKVNEVWGEVNEDGKKTILRAKKELLKRLDTFTQKLEGFGFEKYLKMVEESIEAAKSETQQTAEKLKKLKELFVRDWKRVFGEKKS